ACDSKARCRLRLRARLAAAALPVVLLVTLERAGQGEFAELVPDHGLGDEDRHVLAPVVHRDRVAEHLGDDRRSTRPRLDDGSGVLLVLRLHLLQQVVVDERTLLQAPWHTFSLPGGSARSAALTRGVTTADDHAVARQALAASAPLGLALRVDRVATTGGLPLTTAVRVVDRVHRHAANRRTLALPPHPAGLTPVDVGLVGVADLAHRGAAAHVHTADLARRHPQRGVVALPAEQLDADAGGAGQLGAAARTQLHRVDLRAHRDVAQRQVVARLDVRVRTRLDPVALLEVLRAEDVALLTVHVVEQRDAGGPVRVVLDVRDLGRHAVL